MRPINFIHSGGFLLGRPLAAPFDLPDHLRDALVDAPYTAAQKVFDAAISENVDFVVLTGDLIVLEPPTPRALMFLMRQFERLAEKKIPIYWAAGEEDAAERWPEALTLPPNVHVFSSRHVEEVVHRRRDQSLALLLGQSGDGRRTGPGAFRAEAQGDLFTIAVTNGEYESALLARQRVHYWALGGETRESVLTAPATAHCAGRPQGRSETAVGPHGCTAVRVADDKSIRTRAIACDAVRRQIESIETNGDASSEDLEKPIRTRIEQLARQSEERPVLVAIEIDGDARTAARLRTGGLADELIESLRRQFGWKTPPVFVTEIEPAAIERPFADPDDDDETILGDFRRALGEMRRDPARLLADGASFVPPDAEAELDAMVRFENETDRRQAVAAAAEVGYDLLLGD